ncbi:carbohydrate kinase [uncultured Leifsonia sp.]|uniref:carbohydrate kinase family protein n=1 Tax=uncultured Leifsonia sp. TaxID=340359 RepID=UPI0025F2C44B|nr:carbohydrate kinase [uncultured Leifsonia sp.]
MSSGALVVGEALIDEVVGRDGVRRHPGGSPANVALGLARLHVATRLHTAIGDDEDGRLIRRELAASGAIVTAESETDAPTSKAVAVLGADGSATYEFSVRWAPGELDDLLDPRIIHTGSLGAFLEPGSALVRDIVRRGRAGGAVITFDPNVRPSLVPPPDVSRVLFESIAFSSRLTKLSDEDAEFLYPGQSVHRVLDTLVGAGVAVAAITRGSEGAVLASGEHRVEVPTVPTEVADTVGAGDSFMAALIWALAFAVGSWDGGTIEPSRLEEVGRTAARAAAITVSRPGADLPVLTELAHSNRRIHARS